MRLEARNNKYSIENRAIWLLLADVNLWTELFDSSGLFDMVYLLSIAIKTVSMAYRKMYFSEVAFVCELIFD